MEHTGANHAMRATSGKAVIALVLALVATAAPEPLGTLIAALAIVCALRARVELREHPELRGTVASLIGFMLAAGSLLIAVLTHWLPMVLGAGAMLGMTGP